MTDKKPSIIFRTLDPLFLKAGKPLARHIAKKDTTENILFKRENQTKLIISTAIKGMEKPIYFMKIFFILLIGLFFSYFLYMYFVFFEYSNNITDYQHILTLFLFISTFITIMISIASHSKRVKTYKHYFSNNIIYMLKDKSYRINEFCRFSDSFTIFLRMYSYLVFASALFSIIFDTGSTLMMFKAMVVIYTVSCAIEFISWCFSYLMVAVIYHSDDFGKKQKQISKEKKSTMVPDAV